MRKELTKLLKTKLKELRAAHGITQPMLAHVLDVSIGAVGNWETGNRTPDTEMLDRIARYFNVSVDYLLGRTGETFPVGTNILPLPETREIPLLGEIACGAPILAAENAEETVPLPAHVTADFCLRCKGDSMIGARIYDGDLVYIRRQNDVDDGQIAAVLIDDEATLKRVYKGNGSVILQAENAAANPMIYTGADAESVRILGLAVARKT